MSKIVCFVAMAHHSRFLMPVVEALRLKGHDRLYFTTASDFPFETHAYQLGYPCPILQSYTNDEIKQNIEQDTNKFFDMWKDKFYTLNALQQWPLISSINLMSSAIKEYHHIKKLFEQENPDLLIALHERNRWGKLFGHLCRKAKIPYMTFQEGDYYEDRLSFSVHTEFTSTLLGWGQHTKDRLVKLGCDQAKIVLAGNTHLQNVLKHPVDKEKIFKEYKLDPKKKTVLINVGIQWGVRFNSKLWFNFLPWFKNNPEWQAVVSWHPKVTYNSYITIHKYMLEKFPGIIFGHSLKIYELIPVVDWFVGLGKTTSTVEALCWNKPLITCKGFSGDPDDLYEWKVSQSLEPFVKGRIGKILDCQVPQEIQDGSNLFLDSYFYKRNTQAIEIAVQEAEKLMSEPYQDSWDTEFDNKFLERIKE